MRGKKVKEVNKRASGNGEGSEKSRGEGGGVKEVVWRLAHPREDV